eukprot:552537_1
MITMSLLVLLFLFQTIYSINNTPPAFGGRIKHVIALMFENRSFDHLLGHLKLNNSAIDGCLPTDPQCKCPVNPNDTNSEMISVGFSAFNNNPGGPAHGLAGTAQQLYGINSNANNKTYPCPMNGFIKSFAPRDTLPGDNGKNVMQQFNFSSLPILSSLALEYAVFNAWYSDVPGPTDPNRMYTFMATSQGMGNDNVKRLEEGFIGPNIFKMIDEYYPFNTNISIKQKWRSIWQDVPTTAYIEYVRKHPENGGFMNDFYDLCKTGNLPLFTWLDPAYQNRPDNIATDQGPPHSVLRGEEFLKNVYEAIRASPAWNDTLFLIFYDEHGGLYDHVSPPFAPNPDGINATKYTDIPFDFGRLGVRVPAVLISPWIPKGSVISAGVQNEYFNASQFSHSSLIHTLREQFAPNCPPFTKRDEWSLTFEHVLSLNKPRNDCIENFDFIDLDNLIRIDELNSDVNTNMENCDCSHFCVGESGMAHAVASLCNKQDIVENMLQQGPHVYMPFLINCTNEWYYSGLKKLK